jgi:endonuclease/exonuclease/phosphatase family metal-dependent hydrolase
VQRTNFPRRAGLLAAEIARSNPDVVGLQEVALYEEGDLRLDYLATLMDSLASRGAAYHVVIQNENSDVKLPMRTGTIVSDLRVVDRDVIIARDGVTTVNAKSGIYAAVATRGLGNQPLKQARGWSSVDVELEHTGFRFINTHLEAESQPSVQDAQTTELIELTRHAPGNVIIAGDLNSAADGAHRTYARLRNALLVDVWDWRVPGYTCCNLPDLSNDVPAHVRRVDLVMVFGFFSRTIRAELVGATSGDYRDGLWPSSHAGVVMTIREQ